MTDSQFALGSQLDDITAIHIHHSSQFRDDNVQESVEIYSGRKGDSQAGDNRLARLVHLNLALEREGLCSIRHRR